VIGRDDMNEAERDALKAQLKAEILKELFDVSVSRSPRLWDKVRKMIEAELGGYSPKQKHNIINGISAIVRSRLDIRQVANITEANFPIAKDIAVKVLCILKEDKAG